MIRVLENLLVEAVAVAVFELTVVLLMLAWNDLYLLRLNIRPDPVLSTGLIPSWTIHGTCTG